MRAAHRRVAAAIAVLAAMVTLAACGSDETSSGPQRLDLKIGDLVPRTGFLDQFGEPAQQAADLAVDEIRKAAAKAGAQHKVTITHVDYRSAPKEAVEYAGKFVDAGSSCLVGPWAGGHVGPGRDEGRDPGQGASDHAGGQRRRAVEGRGSWIPEPRRAAGPAPGARARGAARRQAPWWRARQEGERRRVEGSVGSAVHLRQGTDEGVRGRVDREGRPGRPSRRRIGPDETPTRGQGQGPRLRGPRRLGLLRLRRHLRADRERPPEQQGLQVHAEARLRDRQPREPEGSRTSRRWQATACAGWHAGHGSRRARSARRRGPSRRRPPRAPSRGARPAARRASPWACIQTKLAWVGGAVRRQCRERVEQARALLDHGRRGASTSASPTRSACSTAAWVSALTPSTGASARAGRSRSATDHVARADRRARRCARTCATRAGAGTPRQRQAGVLLLDVLELDVGLVEQHVHVLGQPRQQLAEALRGNVRAGRVVGVAEHQHARALADRARSASTSGPSSGMPG